MRSTNINKQLKLAKINFAVKQTDLFKKMASKKGEENNDQFLEKMLKVQEKCTEHVFSDTRRPLKRKRNQAEVLAPQENFDFNREASVAFTPEPQMNLNFSAALNDLANRAPTRTGRTGDDSDPKRKKNGSRKDKTNGDGDFEVTETTENEKRLKKKKKTTVKRKHF
ncbi:unnamed protein product [Meloidogyne enterolobii]|uniref:Uncharacterized protein n=1 Tax=Meloidogyne enterolobii TaxID=390850 RepID=A0ACB1B306_MELEN